MVWGCVGLMVQSNARQMFHCALHQKCSAIFQKTWGIVTDPAEMKRRDEAIRQKHERDHVTCDKMTCQSRDMHASFRHELRVRTRIRGAPTRIVNIVSVRN